MRTAEMDVPEFPLACFKRVAAESDQIGDTYFTATLYRGHV